jgi:D-alanine-D-alanine ligase-like ATP-grasp enzyme
MGQLRSSIRIERLRSHRGSKKGRKLNRQANWVRLQRKVLILAAVLIAVAAAELTVSPALAFSPPGSNTGATQAARPFTSGGWRNAHEVKGLATLGATTAEIYSVSCASAGDCSAGGTYTEDSPPGTQEAFVVDEKDGTWGRAEQVPGMAALNASTSEIESVSCASAGNCSAGGDYGKKPPYSEAFVVNEVNGTWGNAEEVPGIATLNAGRGAFIYSVSCPSPGNCSAGGSYLDHSVNVQAFVADEHDGTWGRAEEVPGTATLNVTGQAQVYSVSCSSAGNCSAGGSYQNNSFEAFIVNEHDGTWGKAEEVPGTATLNVGGGASIFSVSCADAGNCTAVGNYSGNSGNFEPFVVNEHDGTWAEAEEVPGIGSLGVGGGGEVNSLSCGSAGNCSAGGYYENKSGAEAFVVNESAGKWGKAEEVPGSGDLNADGNAQISTLACGSAGNCSAGGYYENKSGQEEAFVVNESAGTWGKAEEVPGSANLNIGGSAAVNSISCASTNGCTAGGYYTKNSGDADAFVVDSLVG